MGWAPGAQSPPPGRKTPPGWRQRIGRTPWPTPQCPPRSHCSGACSAAMGGSYRARRRGSGPLVLPRKLGFASRSTAGNSNGSRTCPGLPSRPPSFEDVVLAAQVRSDPVQPYGLPGLNPRSLVFVRRFPASSFLHPAKFPFVGAVINPAEPGRLLVGKQHRETPTHEHRVFVAKPQLGGFEHPAPIIVARARSGRRSAKRLIRCTRSALDIVHGRE